MTLPRPEAEAEFVFISPSEHQRNCLSGSCLLAIFKETTMGIGQS